MVNEGKVLTLKVVTVVKDDLSGLKRTEKSVNAQSKKVAWTLVTPNDGSTTYQYAQFLKNSKIASDVLLDKHNGVYEAMNQVIDVTNGEDWLWFLNAGDEFAATNTYQLVDAFAQVSPNNWIFGGHFLGSEVGGILGEVKTPQAFKISNQLFARKYVCHQATIFQANLLQEMGGFDLSYKIAADYDLMARASKLDPGTSIDATIAVFYLGGISSRARQKANAELLQLRKKHLGRRFVAKNYVFFFYRLCRNYVLLELEKKSPNLVNIIRKVKVIFK